MLAQVLAMALCPCLCPSAISRCSTETDGRIDLILAWRLLLTSPTLCCQEIQLSTKIRILLSGTFSETPDLKNFAKAYRSSKRVINLA